MVKNKNVKCARVAMTGFACLLAFAVFTGGCSNDVQSANEASEIVSVTALGKMDYDGPKVEAIAVEYDGALNLKDSDVSADTYDITVFDPQTYDYFGSGAIGDITSVYVNSEAAVSETKTSVAGNYVIIEVFTDYIADYGLAYNQSLATSVIQKEDITLTDGTVLKSGTKEVSNKMGSKAKSLNFILPEISGFKFYTDEPGDYGADGGAYHVDNCFNQIGGVYEDIAISYALYLPEDYNENGHYAMVTLQNPAGDDHPIATVLYTRAPSVYASQEAQQLVKDTHGLDGLIIVVPVVTERVNDNGGTPAEYEAMVHFWDWIIETYHVDENHIYGTGQSVGGMIVIETNRNRDNFFAGMLLYEDQWSQNYYVDTIYAREMGNYESTASTAAMHYPRTDSYITWDYSLDTEGNRVYEGHDPYNFFYLMSDDNIMIMNSDDNVISNNAWKEVQLLYSDLTGTTFGQLTLDAKDSLDDQNAALEDWTKTNSPLNIQWITIKGGSNGYSCRKLDSSYVWLLTQSRETEISREKLDINKPFELAEEQIIDDERKLPVTDSDGNDIYFLTAKYGAGTQYYNSSLISDKPVIDFMPGWLPTWLFDLPDDGQISRENGVEGAHIVGVTAIDDSAVAIEYDRDMTNIAVNLKGDMVYNHLSGEYRDYQFIALDPYEFYDADGNKIECAIKNIYVNDSPQTVGGAERQSGSGVYVIVEFEQSLSSQAVAVLQRTTVITNKYIASASWKIYGYDYNNG